MTPVAALRRSDGRVAVRDRLLVLPSVVCATRVAERIADAVGGVGIVHQHGCAQIGDDGVRTAAALEGVACGPNVSGVIVVSLGCETVQGQALARSIAGRGQQVELVGIQTEGGSQRAVAAGRAAATTLRERRVEAEPATVAWAELSLGVEADRPSPAACALVARAHEERMAVVVCDDALRGRADAVRAPAFRGRAEAGRVTVLEGAGGGVQQHVALAAAGVHVIVSFPAPDQPPAGFATCPVAAVAGDSALHRALRDEFDVDEDDGAEILWGRLAEVIGGAPSAAEGQSRATFALLRVARTM